MGLRKASSYSHQRVRPYTRKSKVQTKSYIKTVPASKIVKFTMGDIRGFETGKLNHILKFISNEDIQIRDNAIESTRQLVLKKLETDLPGFYYLQIKIHPHHILRENKMLTGAGADRMQTGMQLSFGVSVGRAAIVKKGHEILVVAVGNEKHLEKARTAINLAKAKIPGTTRITYEKK